MKKYFTFKRFRENLIPFVIIMSCIVVGQYRDGYMTVDEIILTDLMLMIIYVLATLVIDWVRMKRVNSEE